MHTYAQRDRALETLRRCDSDELAQFIIRLAEEDPDVIGERVELFLAAKDPSSLVKKLRRRIAGLKRSTTFVRSRRPDEVLHKLSGVLDPIEHNLISQDPLAALKLLGAFIETDEGTFNRVDDSYGWVGDAYRRACHLFADAAKAAGRSTEAEKWFYRLAASNDFGARDKLFDRVADILNEEAVERLVREWRTRLVSEPINTFGGVRIRLAQVAASIGDPELHEEATLAGRAIEDFPAHAVDIAQIYLQCGQPETALAKMPPGDALTVFRSRDHQDLLIEINRALGREDAVIEQYWQRFDAHPSAATANELLKLLPESEQEAARDHMRKMILGKQRDPLAQARFFAETGELSMASKIVIQHDGGFDGENYPAILDLIKPLEEGGYYLAASVLYRANLEAILNRAKSKNYRYAAKYYRKLDAFSGMISDWASVMPHAAYRERIHATHQRKEAFWRLLE